MADPSEGDWTAYSEIPQPRLFVYLGVGTVSYEMFCVMERLCTRKGLSVLAI